MGLPSTGLTAAIPAVQFPEIPFTTRDGTLLLYSVSTQTAVVTQQPSFGAPLASLFLILTAVVADLPSTARGLPVRMAKQQPCGNDDRRVVVVQVLSGERLKINMDDLKAGDLGQRLEEIFKTRVYRFVFVLGEPTVSFGDVARIIDTARNYLDYVVILPRSALDQDCFDANLPREYITKPPR